MRRENEGVSLGNGAVKRTTDLALLVTLDTGDEIWIPKSQICDNSEVYEDEQEGDVVVSAWWAEKNGLA